MKHTLSIKIDGPDPTQDQLNDIQVKVMKYLPKKYNLQNGRVDGKYVYYDIYLDKWASYSPEDETSYLEGLIAGILMEKGIEII